MRYVISRTLYKSNFLDLLPSPAKQRLTIVPEVVDGKFSSVFKLPLSASTSAVTVPLSLVTKVKRKILEESGISAPKLNELVGSGKLLVDLTIDIEKVVERGLDDVGDVSEVFATQIGNATGLRKPIREAKEEILLIINHPKKVPGRLFEKAKELVEPVFKTIKEWF